MNQQDVNAAVSELADVVPLVKAHLVGRDDVDPSNAVQVREDQLARVFSQFGAIEPPFDPETLCLLLEHSNSLRQNIDAYITNIDGFGHKFEPVINLDSDEAPKQIWNAIYIERLRQQEAGEKIESLEPSEEEVTAKIIELRDLMRRERSKLVNFFEFCCADESFVSLRRRTRQDLETLGNAYWEIIRNGAGEIAQFNYIPGFTIRLLALDKEAVEVDAKVKISDLEFDSLKVQRRFRKLIQVVEGNSVFFKQLGDPRFISRKTGREFKDLEELKRNDATDGPAHEVLHFKIHNPRSAYGTPRWIGNLLSVLGSRQSEEVNFLYFENKSIPPMVMLVSGGRVTQETISRVEDHVKNAAKGRRNFHKILVLEGSSDATAGGGKMKIELKPLTQAIYSDALFQKYDERNIDKVGMSFRLPRMLRGDIRDFNRATAQAALVFAEAQVFQPEREEFDFIINRKILTDMGIRFWRFRSNGPITKDAAQLTDMIVALLRAGSINPGEARQLAEDVFNREFKRIDAPWTDQPLQLSVAGFSAGVETGEGGKNDLTVEDLETGGGLLRPQQEDEPDFPASIGKQHLTAQAEYFVKIRDAIRDAEHRAAEEEFLAAKADDELDDGSEPR